MSDLEAQKFSSKEAAVDLPDDLEAATPVHLGDRKILDFCIIFLQILYLASVVICLYILLFLRRQQVREKVSSE